MQTARLPPSRERRKGQEKKNERVGWRRPVQSESAMRGAGRMRADRAPEKNTDGRDGRGAGLGVTGGTKG